MMGLLRVEFSLCLQSLLCTPGLVRGKKKKIKIFLILVHVLVQFLQIFRDDV